MAIGVTPVTIPVDLEWGLRWMKRQWEELSVQSLGGILQPRLSEENNQDIELKIAIEKEGFEKHIVRDKVLSIAYPGQKWTGTNAWPRHKTVSYDLKPRQAESGALEKSQMRTVILAGSEISAVGALVVWVNADDADVFMDRKHVGKAPVKLVLTAGQHELQVQAQGMIPFRRSVEVPADRETSVKAVLSPQER